MKIDQNTGVSLFIVGVIVSGGAYIFIAVGEFRAQMVHLDAVQIEKRLTAIETTLNIISQRQRAAMFKAPAATLIEAAPR